MLCGRAHTLAVGPDVDEGVFGPPRGASCVSVPSPDVDERVAVDIDIDIDHQGSTELHP